jgi:acyl-CoA thioester hydrolase
MSDQTPAPAPKKRRPSTRKRKPAKDMAVVAEGAAEGSAEAPSANEAAAPPKSQRQRQRQPQLERQREPRHANGPDTVPTAPPPLIRVPISVRWRDLDAFNHVNNSKFLSYLEEARLRWMITMPGMGLEDHIAPVVAASNLNYRRPIGWPGEVIVELFVERLGNTSLTVGHRIVDAADGGAVYCDGHVVMVWIDREAGSAAPLPEFVRAACAAAAG